MSDLISRKDAVDALTIEYMDRGVLGEKWAVEKCIDAIKNLPPAEKTGRRNWIGFNIECSLCGFTPCFDSTEPLYNYCPNCGAKMEVEE
jgi:hypothetical protein